MMQSTTTLIRQGYTRRKIRLISVNIVLLALTVCLCGMMLVYGKTNYQLSTVIRVIRGEQIQGATFAIATLRLPRMLCGLLAGLAFGMAGSTFQTMLRNPLASPDIIGISSGSSAAAVFCILVLHMSGSGVSIAAVASGIAVSILIYALSKGSKFSGSRLILIGIGVQAMINSLISYLLSKASQHDVPAALRWLSGSLNGMRIEDVPVLGIVVVVFGITILLLTKQLKILELGDEFATTLGININVIRIMLILSSVFLIAFATAVTGPIAFVAFLSGPIASRLVGPGASNALSSGLVGALLVLGADMTGQFAFGTRFPVGVVTGILGAPYMLFLLVLINRRGKA